MTLNQLIISFIAYVQMKIDLGDLGDNISVFSLVRLLCNFDWGTQDEKEGTKQPSQSQASCGLMGTHVEIGSTEPRLQALHDGVLSQRTLQVDEVLEVSAGGWRLEPRFHHRRGRVGSGASGRYGRLRRRRRDAVSASAPLEVTPWGSRRRLERGRRWRSLHMEPVAQRQQLRAEAAQALLQVDGFVRRRRIWKKRRKQDIRVYWVSRSCGAEK